MIRRLADALLDASIVFSFDRTGFRRHARRFATGALDVDLGGSVCLVTGGNSGIGRAAALAFARRGADVWLLCRSQERGREAEAALREESGSRRVHLDVTDVSSLAAVREFAARFPEKRVDVLVHNAGVLPATRLETAEGLESTFATHVAGPFLLTRLLEPKLDAGTGSRVIFVSSGGMYTRRLSLEDPGWERRPYDGVAAYAQTKRMQVVLAELLAERYRERSIRVHAMHPGWADTPAVRSSLPRFHSVMRPLLRTPEEGADTVVWLAVAPEAARRSGLFWFDRAPRGTYYLPVTREDEADRRALWRLCERVTGHAEEGR
jgi:NAD(P)-dependent dehydrogenase (short-subunit alcohol dehydrogenase family)